ncbi:hypothetical protein C0992_010480 [Termitomyces sp. T32_za158]|nr:hypothetical protein C0992_010480 [Termitomyces sp. T32_za158]
MIAPSHHSIVGIIQTNFLRRAIHQQLRPSSIQQKVVWMKRAEKLKDIRKGDEENLEKLKWIEGRIDEMERKLESNFDEIEGRLDGIERSCDGIGRRRDEIGRRRDEIGRRRDEIGRRRDEIGRRRDEIGRRRDEIGRRRDEIGRRRDEIGRRRDGSFDGIERSFERMEENLDKIIQTLQETTKLLVTNRILQMKDDANDVLQKHLLAASFSVTNTSFERRPCLHGKTLFKWDSIIESQQENKKVLWLVEVKQFVQEKHISTTIPTKLEETLAYIKKIKELDLSKLPEKEQKAAAQWATFTDHRLHVVVASPNITHTRAKQILAAGQDALYRYQDSFKESEKPSGKKRTSKNPILADGSVKQGRTRNYPVEGDPKSIQKQAKKRKLEAALDEKVDNEQPESSKKRRLTAIEEAGMLYERVYLPRPIISHTDSMRETPRTLKKRGRPPKGKQKETDQPQEATPTLTKQRGKSFKVVSHAADEATLSADQRALARGNGDTTTDGAPSIFDSLPRHIENARQESSSQGDTCYLRRENELYRVVENMGGIVNIQTKDFFEEHIDLLEVMTKAGEPTSAPAGTRTDKRTAVSTFNNLEKRGRIKQLKTSVMTHTGVACIVTVSQEMSNNFLSDLSRGVQSTPHPEVPKGTIRRTFPTRTVPVPVDPVHLSIAGNPPERPVETLIAMQGPPTRSNESVKGRTLKVSVELARDASAIIRARCRNLPRLDWAAFEQVFPAVPQYVSVSHIFEKRQEMKHRWYEIWGQHRGTPLLPDDDPMSANNFNIIKQIEFLRQHVDKNALRVGFAQPKESAGTTLSASVDLLLAEYDIVESTLNAPSWDFVWNAAVEEGREKQMLCQPFLKTPEEMPPVLEAPSETVSLAESALKVTLGTPHECYDPELGSTLLHTIGEHYVSFATKNLLSRGVLSKLVRDLQKQKPGRQLKISEG